MGFCNSVDRTQLFNLLSGMMGIYILYFIAGILHESIVKRPHFNRITKNYQICDNVSGILLVPFAFAWIMGWIHNILLLPSQVQIPHKNSAITAGAIVAATYFSLLAMQRTSFPVVIMFQSCSILPVIFVAVFCSRVHDPNLKIGPKKIIVALIITAGILTFQFADPQTKQRETKQQVLGIIFLIFHFICQGFLPDLQAEIKVNFKPEPTEMMAQINKWCTILTAIISLVTMNLWPFVVFMWEHLEFTADLVIMSVVSGFGQFFVYRMIKQFKQHFVPFTISSRKILTATISIVFYNHQTNWIQIMGICVVLFTVFVEFMTEITKPDPKERSVNKDIVHELNQEKFEQQFKAPQQNNNQKSIDAKPVEIEYLSQPPNSSGLKESEEDAHKEKATNSNSQKDIIEIQMGICSDTKVPVSQTIEGEGCKENRAVKKVGSLQKSMKQTAMEHIYK